MRVTSFKYLILIVLIASVVAVSIPSAYAELEIWNNGPKGIGEQVSFYANYTNDTSGGFISGAECTIYFEDGVYNLSEINLYVYQRSFNSSNTFDYTISCSSGGFEQLNLSDNVSVLHLPNVVLNSPLDDSSQAYELVVFNFTGVDSDGIKNATLFGNFSGNWGANVSNNSFVEVGLITVHLSEGSYLWNVYVCNNNDMCSYAQDNYTFNFAIAAPTISLISPEDGNTWTSSSSVNLTYEVDDYYGIINCSLYIDSIKVEDDTIISIGENNFTKSLSDGDYDWFVGCINSKNKSDRSSSYSFTVNYEDLSSSSTSLTQSSTTSSLSNSTNFNLTNSSINYSNLTLSNNTVNNQSRNLSGSITGNVIGKIGNFKGRGIGLFILTFFITTSLGFLAYKMVLRYGFKEKIQEDIYEPTRRIGDEEDQGILPENSWESDS